MSEPRVSLPAGLSLPLAEHLVDRALAQRHPAWIVTDRAGRITEAGGELAFYGLDDLQPGADIRSVSFAESVFAAHTEPLVLPAVRLANGRSADLLLAAEPEALATLLLDADPEVYGARPYQQLAHELRLQLERVAATGAQVPEQVLGAMDAVVYGHGDDGNLTLLSTPLPWLLDLAGRHDGEPPALSPAALSPFLEHFVAEAAELWAAGQPARLRSGPWTETLPDGSECPLEATAVVGAAGARALVVQRLAENFRERSAFLQKARSTVLEYEGLRREIQKKELLLDCLVHDLKGPLSVIVGNLSLLRSPTLDPDRAQGLLATSLVHARKQLDMIRLVLDVFSAEIEAMEEFQVDPATAPDARACVEALVSDHGPSFEQRGVRLQLDAPDDSRRLPVVGDAARLERVLTNLLENALRHAPRGSTVSVGLRDGGEEVLVHVEDQGPGVDPEVVEDLFEKFGRGRRSGGMAGLGLYFCRTTVERWGGRIGYERAHGGGARFWCRLVAAQPVNPTAPRS